jgi:hypothetical protein
VDEKGETTVDIDDYRMSKSELDRLVDFFVNHPSIRLLLLYK